MVLVGWGDLAWLSDYAPTGHEREGMLTQDFILGFHIVFLRDKGLGIVSRQGVWVFTLCFYGRLDLAVMDGVLSKNRAGICLWFVESFAGLAIYY